MSRPASGEGRAQPDRAEVDVPTTILICLFLLALIVGGYIGLIAVLQR
ncbi:hypothetical protein [Pseudofrankia asymbiotica]|nr:hypothetical protein [Pseudofrankia asymbiotica]